MDEEVAAIFERAGLRLTPTDEECFELLREAVVEANRSMNLTRITESREFHLKHVLDSALPFLRVPALRELGERALVADLGSGAGFPGLVLARLFPDRDLALIERTQKKAAFLEETLEALGLENAHVVPLDAREAAARVPTLRHRCDVVTARAVGRIAAVTRAAAPLLRPGGLMVHYKGGAPDTGELEEGDEAARRLGLEQRPPVAYELPPDARRSVVLTISPPSGRTRGAGPRRSRARRGSPRGRAP